MNTVLGGYGGVTRAGDVGMFWSDSDGQGGKNATSGLVIAPWVDGSHGMRIAANGNVSIGVPHWNSKGENYKLAVNGRVICTELKVQLYNDWPDYVFSDDYQRMALEELASYIEANHHLPNIQSAAEMESEGIDVSKMTTLQMEKIEELTLYILELNKKIEALEKQVETLRN